MTARTSSLFFSYSFKWKVRFRQALLRNDRKLFLRLNTYRTWKYPTCHQRIYEFIFSPGIVWKRIHTHMVAMGRCHWPLWVAPVNLPQVSTHAGWPRPVEHTFTANGMMRNCLLPPSRLWTIGMFGGWLILWTLTSLGISLFSREAANVKRVAV